MSDLLQKLKQDFPHINFVDSDSFYWSPRKQTVYYRDRTSNNKHTTWALLHEVGHALLEHRDYQSDFDLLQLEIAAWEKARKLAEAYAEPIHEDHVQDCLDTYRDWLYLRSTCPKCTSSSLQINTSQYCCLNCNEIWTVSRSRRCRTYRRRTQKNQLS